MFGNAIWQNRIAGVSREVAAEFLRRVYGGAALDEGPGAAAEVPGELGALGFSLGQRGAQPVKQEEKPRVHLEATVQGRRAARFQMEQL